MSDMANNSRERGSSPLREIEELLEGEHSWDFDWGLLQLERIFNSLIAGGNERILDEGIRELVLCVGAIGWEYELAQQVVRWLLASQIRGKVVKALIHRAHIHTNYVNVMTPFASLSLLEPSLDLEFAFLCELAPTFAKEDLTNADEEDLQAIFPELAALLIEEASAPVISSVVRMAARVREATQCYAISIIRERFERSDGAERGCISEGLKLELPTSIHYFKPQGTKSLHSWGEKLLNSASSTSLSLGKVLITLPQDM